MVPSGLIAAISRVCGCCVFTGTSHSLSLPIAAGIWLGIDLRAADSVCLSVPWWVASHVETVCALNRILVDLGLPESEPDPLMPDGFVLNTNDCHVAVSAVVRFAEVIRSLRSPHTNSQLHLPGMPEDARLATEGLVDAEAILTRCLLKGLRRVRRRRKLLFS